MGLISRHSKVLLNLEALLEPSSYKAIQALRLKYGGMPKAPNFTPWSKIGLSYQLSPSGVDYYRKAIAHIASLHAPFDIQIGSTFRWRSHSQKLNQVGLSLPSVELEGIHKELVRAIKSPFLSALRASNISEKNRQSTTKCVFLRGFVQESQYSISAPTRKLKMLF
jgi:hypothetical protein